MKIIFDTFEINVTDPKIEQKIAQCLFSTNQQVSTEEKQPREKKAKPKNTFQPWTTEEEVQMLDYLQQGKSYKQIGILLERPTNAIYQRNYKIIAEKKAEEKIKLNNNANFNKVSQIFPSL